MLHAFGFLQVRDQVDHASPCAGTVLARVDDASLRDGARPLLDLQLAANRRTCQAPRGRDATTLDGAHAPTSFITKPQMPQVTTAGTSSARRTRYCGVNQVVAPYPSIATSTFTRYPSDARPMLRLHAATPSAPVVPVQLETVVL
jgi:hypothetical protein